jgi:glycosyltransferase involved in cell wall biosynthesis
MVNVAPLTDLVASADLVIANTLVNWRAVHAARAFAKPSLLWVHESGYGRDLARAHQGVADAVRQADAIILPAAALVDVYRDFLVDGRYSVVPYGVAASPALPALQPRSPAASPRVSVVHIGSLEPRKGQDLLLEALATLSPETRDTMDVVFVGRTLQPAFRASLDRMAHGMPHVRFAGEVDHAEALARLQASDIFVLSSRDEVLPVSMLEAMAQGKAVIATNVGGVAETLEDGANGLLVEAGDRDRLAAALLSLARDASRRDALGREARATILRRHSMEGFVQTFVAHVRQAMADRGRVAT